MVVALLALLILVAVALTWVLFRDTRSPVKLGDPVVSQEQAVRERERRAGE